MIKTNTVLTLIVSTLLFSTLLLSLPEDGHAGRAFSLGCCTSEMPSECLGCPPTENNCAITQFQCLNTLDGDFFSGGQVCIDTPVGGECASPDDTGCCVLTPGTCTDDTVISECGGDLWIQSASCEAVALCGPRPVPTLNQWGLVALAGVFILVGIWAITRKKATT